jgi:hypothetical protein
MNNLYLTVDRTESPFALNIMKPGMNRLDILLADQRRLTRRNDPSSPKKNKTSIQIGKRPSQRRNSNKKRTSTRCNVTAYSHAFCAVLDVTG